MNPSLLVVEDDEVMCKTIAEVFEKKGLRVLSAKNGEDAIIYLTREIIDLALIDFRLPGMNGLTLLKAIKEMDDGIMVIVMTAYPEVKMAISAMKAGAYDYINKPFELEELKLLIDKALEIQKMKFDILRLQRIKCEEDYFGEMIGTGSVFNELKGFILKVAKAPKTPILIQGESGVGKELVANAIHQNSDRAGKPFLKVNCSAIPDTLLEAELFGYEKGAFTDAKQSRKGLFELSDGGTLFLDEIGDMKPHIQPKILRVIEYQNFRKIGGNRDIQVDVRIITATNRDLKTMVEKGLFREDLYYRLKVMTINVPPLRERREDIIHIVDALIKNYNKLFGKNIKGLSDDAMSLLYNYPWPGNIRELKNVIERACILSGSDIILPSHLPEELRNTEKKNLKGAEINRDLKSLQDVERNHIIRILGEVEGNKSSAAKILGISRLTLREKMKKYGIEESA
ncbi:MAG: sigma-54-dependent Fis family transcriptional regulator [Nitrospinae bacterium]|nr:sigma-54-dependent Fis family transcriptional regulator [Nitrospinota bacterium]